MKKLTRRRFIYYLAGSSALSVMPKIGFSAVNNVDNKDILLSVITAFHSKKSAAIIGREYLRQYPNEKNMDVLYKSLKIVPLHNEIEKSEVCLCLADKMENDFSRGDVINLQGWLLSRTELRLCALLSLVG